MGDNEYEIIQRNPIRVERRLKMISGGVIQFREPMADQFEDRIVTEPPPPVVIRFVEIANQITVANVYQPTDYQPIDTNEWADVNKYFLQYGQWLNQVNYIIGWSVVHPQNFHIFDTILFTQMAKLFTEDEAMEVFTDTIFPVITDLKGNPLQYQTQLPDEYNTYEPTIQLVLMDPKPGETHQRRDIEAVFTCDPTISDETHTLRSLKADLRLYITNMKSYLRNLSSQAIVRFILDKQNPNCPLVGLYAGPDLPPKTDRQCWPIYERGFKASPEYQYRPPFRHTANQKQFHRRIGYLVSKQALLCVCERKQHKVINRLRKLKPIYGIKEDDHHFTSLLKDNTFCICDSNHSIGYELRDLALYPYVMPFAPKVIVVPEGLNMLAIFDYFEQDAQYAKSFVYLKAYLLSQFTNSSHILSLDWYKFQNDFDAFGQPIEPYLQLNMNLDDINDYKVYPIEEFDANICFSLIYCHQTLDLAFNEKYNVFIETPAQPDGARDRSFYYLMDIQFLWIKCHKHGENQPLIYKKHLFFKNIIKGRNEEQGIAKDIKDYFLSNVKMYAFRLADTPVFSLSNLSPISMPKYRLIKQFNLRFIDPLA